MVLVNGREVVPTAPSDKTVATIEKCANRLGYRGDLVRKQYVFLDVSGSGTRTIPLATFAQTPPSYRNACFGVVISNGRSGAEYVHEFRGLGAPMVFEISDSTVNLWKMAIREQSMCVKPGIQVAALDRLFDEHRNEWEPQAILRAKAISRPEPRQLDFIDVGFLPALEGIVHKKLDDLLRRIVYDAEKHHKKVYGGISADGHRQLFRLVFRLLAAKVLGDRGVEGEWVSPGVEDVLGEVEKYYFKGHHPQSLTSNREIRETAWERIRGAFHFQNLSVDDLAFVYENTLITPETRKSLGIHNTPPRVAEYVVNNLPFESVPQEKRRIFEPCAGHGAFLLAAMRRLRELLPLDWTDSQRHRYFTERLSGVEIDAFAVEVCWLCLVLADFPNPDGWQVKEGNVFVGKGLESECSRSDIVLCNPPFEDFTQAERRRYMGRIGSTHKPVEVLSRILKNPPALLGFVLPRPFLDGPGYREIRNAIARTYDNVQFLALPDRVFKYSGEEAAVVLGSGTSGKGDIRLRFSRVGESDRQAFIQDGSVPEPEAVERMRPLGGEHISFLIPSLSPVWEYLRHYPLLGQIADIHRGIEYSIPLGVRGHAENRARVISTSPRPDFKEGLFNVPGVWEPFVKPQAVYLNMDPALQRGKALAYPWRDPKVIVNAATVSRRKWRMVAVCDRSGLICYQRFLGAWPKGKLPVEMLAALLNGPVANAFVASREGKLDNRIATLRDIPVPEFSNVAMANISGLVQQYVSKIGHGKPFGDEAAKLANKRRLLLDIDAAVLKCYDLPPRLERKLLDSFRGDKRPGFDGPCNYFPKDFMPSIPLHEYLSPEFQEARADKTLARMPKVRDRAISRMLESLKSES